MDKKRKLKYNEIPDHLKLTLELDSGQMDLNEGFVGFIQKLRSACARGITISRIPEAHCPENLCPVVEVEIKDKTTSTRLLIERSTVYVIGYTYRGQWQIFNDAGFELDIGKPAGQTFHYEYDHPKQLGANTFYTALHNMDHEKSEVRKRSCEKFFFQISEAVRFYPVQHQVSLGIQCGADREFNNGSIPEELVPFKWFKPRDPADRVGEIRSLLEPLGISNFNVGKDYSPFLGELVKKWGHLSQIWQTYAASGHCFFEYEKNETLLRKCGIGCIRSLRETLALLSDVNFPELQLKAEELKKHHTTREIGKKIATALEEWKGKRKLGALAF